MVSSSSDPADGAPESYNDRPDTETARRAVQAWERMQNNSQPTDEAEQARNEAAVTMEETNWDAVANVPVFHESQQRFAYEWADLPKFGTGGSFKQKYNRASVGERS